MGLLHYVLVYMGDLQLVYPVLNLSTLDAGILMVQCISLMMFSLNIVDYPMSFLLLYSCSSHSKMFLLFPREPTQSVQTSMRSLGVLGVTLLISASEKPHRQKLLEKILETASIYKIDGLDSHMPRWHLE